MGVEYNVYQLFVTYHLYTVDCVEAVTAVGPRQRLEVPSLPVQGEGVVDEDEGIGDQHAVVYGGDCRGQDLREPDTFVKKIIIKKLIIDIIL